jgi:hypothetical protein
MEPVGQSRLIALGGEDPAARAVAFETCTLEALSISETNRPWERWAAVYARASAKLAASEERGEFETASSGWLDAASSVSDPRDHDAVWGLIYAARTFQIGVEILRAYPAPPGRFIELGAGWGPFALAAAASGHQGPFELADLSEGRLRRAERLFASAGAAAPVLRIGDVRSQQVGPCSAIAAPFSFGELSPRTVGAREDARRIGAWVDALQPGGRLYLVEPGTRGSSRRLQALRDALVGAVSVVAPCFGAPRCPLLAGERDWCHFTRRWALGPVGQRIADSARRRWQELHFSWLVLAKQDGIADEQGLARVLENRRLGRGKVGVRVCDRDGAAWVTGLERNASVRDVLSGLEPGAVVEIHRDALERRGDGLRLARGADLRVHRSL